MFVLKVALQILGWKFYKNAKKSPLYSQIHLIFIHKTSVVDNHPTAQVDTDGNHSLFLHEQLAHLHTGNTKRKFPK